MDRKCKKCGKTKRLLDFPINNTLASGILRKHTCNSCRGHQNKVRMKLHQENKRPKLIVCPICEKETDKVVLDHNHSTDKFRGWLCNDCNNALGKFNDDIFLLKKAIKYLKKSLD
jgi:protein-arginine kinase activator protein McsA